MRSYLDKGYRKHKWKLKHDKYYKLYFCSKCLSEIIGDTAVRYSYQCPNKIMKLTYIFKYYSKHI
jgi:hypothetical protein